MTIRSRWLILLFILVFAVGATMVFERWHKLLNIPRASADSSMPGINLPILTSLAPGINNLVIHLPIIFGQNKGSATPTQSLTPISTSTKPLTLTAKPDQSPTITSTFTNTPARSLTPTLTLTRTPAVIATTVTPHPINTQAFPIGPGGSDVIPHQIVRTIDDRLYVFVYKGDSSNQITAYWMQKTGLPTGAADFSGKLSIADNANIISVETVYDGGNIIHVLTNGQDGMIKDRPFDTSTNTYRPARVIASNGGTVVGSYIGTSGLSAMLDTAGTIHLVYWSSSNHIEYLALTYQTASDQLTVVEGPTQLDNDGPANHPTLAISPKDGSITVAWISQSARQILLRNKASGNWSAEVQVNDAKYHVWTSTDSGINIDQGPGLWVSADGVTYITYIEDWQVTTPYDYGRVHFVNNKGGVWVDQYTGFYTHDPALAISGNGQVYVIGHGYPLNLVCKTVSDVCLYQRNGDGSWAEHIFLAHQGTQSFDSSVSIKRSVVGQNRPDAIEFIFSDAGNGYNATILYYGDIQ